MEKICITITGTNFYKGIDPLKLETKVKLLKEKENAFDKEAIRVEIEDIGKVGYVANSYHTIIKGCQSGSRIYDKLGDVSYGKVAFITEHGVICEIIDFNVDNKIKNKGYKDRPMKKIKRKFFKKKSKDEKILINQNTLINDEDIRIKDDDPWKYY